MLHFVMPVTSMLRSKAVVVLISNCPHSYLGRVVFIQQLHLPVFLTLGIYH